MKLSQGNELDIRAVNIVEAEVSQRVDSGDFKRHRAHVKLKTSRRLEPGCVSVKWRD